jgi:hypothetical protein
LRESSADVQHPNSKNPHSVAQGEAAVVFAATLGMPVFAIEKAVFTQPQPVSRPNKFGVNTIFACVPKRSQPE